MQKKIIITYGTYDLLHIGHINLLKRAKALGDYLIVGVTSEDYDCSRGKLNVKQSTKKRVKEIKKLDFVDEVIIEKHKNQKQQDIVSKKVDIFAIGDDWVGKFDYLNEFTKVVYLPRTEGISSTLLRSQELKDVKIGIIGTGRIANRFVIESRNVSNIILHSVYSTKLNNVTEFIKSNDIPYGFNELEEFLNSDIKAVYIASPHQFHYEQIKKCLENKKHVLCEKPAVLEEYQLKELITIAKTNNLIFLEAIKTAFFPAFNKLLDILKTDVIGEIKDVKATFTKLIDDKSSREWDKNYGGSITELLTYPLLLSQKILGKSKKTYTFKTISNDVDSYSVIVSKHKNNTLSTSTVGIGVKSEGSAIISGTKGYIYIPAPWWLTKDFFIRGEDSVKEESYHFDLEGSGLRYEISEFITLIQRNKIRSKRLTYDDMLEINKVLIKARNA